MTGRKYAKRLGGLFAPRQRTVSTVLTIASLLLVLSAIDFQAPQAFGHPVPISYSPQPNFIFSDDSSDPSRIVISFSERPDPKTSFIHVVDSANERIDNDDFMITGQNAREATVSLDAAKLSDGTYSVTWRALSLDDGHITEGAYVFGLGLSGTGLVLDNASPDEQIQTKGVTSTIEALLKWPVLVAQTAIVGLPFAYLVFRKGFNLQTNKNDLQEKFKAVHNDYHLPPMKMQTAKRFTLLLVASSLTIILCSTALLIFQSANLSSSDPGSNSLIISQSLVLDSPMGTIWIMRIISTIVAIAASVAFLYGTRKTQSLIRSGAVNRAKSPIIPILIILVAGGVSIFSNSMLSDNSAVQFRPTVAVFADWLNLMGVSVWIGGLFYLAAIAMQDLRATNPEGPVTYFRLSLMLPRFSMMAMISLAVIGITGIYMAAMQLQNLDSLFTTSYGSSLTIKLAAALPMVLLGAFRQLKLHRNMVLLALPIQGRAASRTEIGFKLQNYRGKKKANSTCLSDRFAKTVRIESLIGIGVLLAASFLTITSSPALPAATGSEQTVTNDMMVMTGDHHSSQDGSDQMDSMSSMDANVEPSSSSNQAIFSVEFTWMIIALSLNVAVLSGLAVSSSREKLKTTIESIMERTMPRISEA